VHGGRLRRWPGERYRCPGAQVCSSTSFFLN
jgi:hypothetical protein